MNIVDIIMQKRLGQSLANDTIEYVVKSIVDKSVKDYQISALLMAIYFQGMDKQETACLTKAMVNSGNTLVHAPYSYSYVDKHSTGGVGDGTSLVVAPLVASCGVRVPMISGRALGHTGGTLDKLDSIPGYSTQLSQQQFMSIIEEVGFAMCGQTDDLAPADRYLYALRDVTGTVESNPLIVSSILSKKIAEGAQALVLDIKSGAGAFFKDIPSAQSFQSIVSAAAEALQMNISTVITNMNTPLGCAIGNFFEVEQAAHILGGYVSEFCSEHLLKDYLALVMELSSRMLVCAGRTNAIADAKQLLRESLENGSAWNCFVKNIQLQNGNVEQFIDLLGNHRAEASSAVTAAQDGCIADINALVFGRAGVTLGVGRITAESSVRYNTGIIMHVQVGDTVRVGDPLCTLYGATSNSVDEAQLLIEKDGIVISSQKTERANILF